MSEIKRLIEDLCPEGVEWKKLGELAKIMNGKDYKSFPSGDIPVYGTGGIMSYINTYAYDKPSVLLPRKGSIDKIYYVDVPFWTVDTIYWTKIDDTLIIPKFLYFFISTINLVRLNTGTGAIPSLTQAVLNKLEIPVPPLPVQAEIVRILDKFTSLEAELEAELEARRKQYEYYRNELLSFHKVEGVNNIKWVKLGDVCDIKGRIGFRGYTRNDQVSKGEGALSLSPANIVNGTMNFDTGTYITWNKYEESPEIKTFNGDIIFCKTGTVGKVALVERLPFKATINPQLVILKEIKINARYLKYILGSYTFQTKVKSLAGIGSVPNISQAKLASIEIPLPPLSEQQRIVGILDCFEALTTDLQSGLPAEIAARRRQYEYYREKLLTFERIKY